MTYLNSADKKGTLLPVVFTAGMFVWVFFPAALIPFFWAVDHMLGYQIRDFLKRKQTRAAFPPSASCHPHGFTTGRIVSTCSSRCHSGSDADGG